MRSKRMPALFIPVIAICLSGGLSRAGEPQQQKLSVPSQKQKEVKPKKGKILEGSRAEYYKKWLDEDVIYVISDDERKVFKSLQTDEERESFIEQFWLRRDTDPRTPDNEFKEEHYRRIAYSNERYASGIPGWKTDRGRIYIMYGQPAEIESHPSGGTYNREIYEGGGTTSTFPFERWRYRHIDGVGDDVEIEFVDRSMSGEYRIAMSPDEKDALLFVPGAGLTLNEEMGLSQKQDRPYFNPSAANDPSQNGYMRAKDQPFERLAQYFNLQRPPQIKFDDLRTLVTTKVTFSNLPYDLRTDYIRLPITLELQNQNLEFKKEYEVNRAAVNIYAVVSSLTNRIIAEWEDTVTVEYTDTNFNSGKLQRSTYQHIVGLPPGQRFKLDLVLKDINSGNTGVIQRGIPVPKYDAEELQTSSVILANKIEPLPNNSDQLGQFVLGDLKVQPNVKAEYTPGQNLIPYVQVYNATIDQTSLKPALEITYTIKSGDKVIEELKDNAGDSIQFFSGQRVVVLGKIPLKEYAPAKYTLTIQVTDKISSRTVTVSADFKVN
jgi:GWxTD domain-containing protein